MRRSLTPAALVLALALVPAGLACSSDDDATETGSGTSGSDSPTGSGGTGAPAEVDQTPPDGANGIKVAEDGTLWVASINSDEVLQVDPTSGEILARHAMPAGTGPDDLDIDDDDEEQQVWITGFSSGDVLALDPATGEVTSLGNVGAGANPITALDGDSLLVGRAVTATGLFSVDPTGQTDPRALEDPGNVNSFDLGDAGNVYGPLTGDGGGSVIAIDPTTGATTRTVTTLTGIPVALRAVDTTLYVLVLDPTAKVVTVDSSSGEVTPFGDTGLTTADNLAVAEDGTVYVTGFSEPTITVMGPDGSVTETLTIGRAG